MAVAGEVQQAVGAHVGETLITLGIDLRPHILQGTVLVLEVNAPNIGAALSARHVAGEIEPLPVRADSRVAVVAQGVGGDFKLLRCTPLGLTAATGVNLDHRWPVLPHGTCQIHGRAVGGESGGSLVVLGIQSAVHHLGSRPLSFLVLFREVNVAFLSASNLAMQLTRRFLVGRSKIDVLLVLIQIHRAIVGASRIEHLVLLDDIARTFLFPFRGQFTTFDTHLGLPTVRSNVQILVVALDGGGILPLALLSLSQPQHQGSVLILVADGVLERC